MAPQTVIDYAHGRSTEEKESKCVVTDIVSSHSKIFIENQNLMRKRLYFLKREVYLKQEKMPL